MFAADPLPAIALVSSVSFLVYYNSLWGGFVFDDHRAILTNDDLDAEKTELWGLFVNDFWGGHMSRTESHKSYRPLTVLTYRCLNFWFSQLEPFSYHLVNIVLHCVASVLFFLVCRRLLGRNWPSLYAAILFSVHSIHTESIASVVGRAETLACTFFLLSLLLYMKGVSKGSGKMLAPIQYTKWLFVFLSIAMSFLSLLSKEQGVTVLGVSSAFDVFINWENIHRSLFKNKRDVKKEESDQTSSEMSLKQTVLTRASTKTSTAEKINDTQSNGDTASHGRHGKLQCRDESNIHKVIQRVVLLVMCGLILVWFRMSMNYGSNPVFKPYEMRAAFHPERSVRMLSFNNLYAHNMWLLLCPSLLCCDWSLGTVPLVTSLSDYRNFYSLILYIALILLTLRTLYSKRDRVVVGMGMTLLVLPFLPASGALVTVGFVIAERVLYMPSLGFCLLVAIGTRRLAAVCPKVMVPVLHGVMVSVVVVTAAKTVSRNQDWSSDLALFTAGVKVNPNNVKLRNNLGMELKDAGRLEEAQQQYLMAMKIDPEYGEVLFNYGNLLSDAGLYEKAAVIFEKSLEYPGTALKTLNNLATMYYRLGRWTESELLYKESLDKNGDHETTYNNLASLYGATNRFKESESMFRKALELNPQYTEAFFNLGTLYIQMERYKDAELNLKRALELNPGHYGATNNLKAVETLVAQKQEQALYKSHH